MELSKFISGKPVTIKRSQIKLANYNPRKISDKALKMLKANIKRVGLMGGLVWNSTTGNLVSGHQRLSVLDQLNKYEGNSETDYLIPVEEVNLDPKTEKEQNIFLNNQNVQGQFDNDLLSGLIGDIDYDLAGLDEYDLNMLGVMDINTEPSASDVMQEFDELQKPVEEKKAHVKDIKKQVAEAAKNKVEEGESYFMMSFDSFENKMAFMQRFGFDPGDKFVKGEVFSDMIEKITE